MEDFREKTDEVISRFKNGKELYRKSPLFSVVVQMLVRGDSEYDVIEKIIHNLEDTQKAFNEYVVRDTRPFINHS